MAKPLPTAVFSPSCAITATLTPMALPFRDTSRPRVLAMRFSFAMVKTLAISTWPARGSSEIAFFSSSFAISIFCAAVSSSIAGL